jgi:hypothetical protein
MRTRTAFGIVVLLVVVTSGGSADAVPAAPTVVSAREAVRITEMLAKHSPPLPASVAAMLQAHRPRIPSAELRGRLDAALADYRAGGESHDGHGGDHHWEKNGFGCYAQGFDRSGKLVHRNEHDSNDNGKLDPWERNPNANETCTEVVLFAYDQRDYDKGSFTLETRTEKDPTTGRTYKRTAARWNYVADNRAHHDHECAPTAAQWKAGMSYVAKARASLSKYVGNPMLAWRDGYRPYPVPGTKTFHWFNRPRWEDGRTLDPNHVEMFVATVTDDGWRPVNISPIYRHEGADPVSFDPNTDTEASRNAGAGCLIEWHRHLERFGGAEGAATGNPDGRDWMGHLWIYGGLYPFGDRDVDGSEPHGWYAPLNNVPVLANSEGSGI